MTATNDRGQMSAQAAVTLVVGLMIFGVLAAVMLPVAVDQIEGNQTDVLTQDNNTAVEVNSQLNSTVTDVSSGTPDTVTVQLNDTRTSGTTSNTIDNGTTTDYSMFDGQTVTVGVEDADTGTSPDSATLNYTYANDYTYSDAGRSLWGLLGLAIVLAAVLFVMSIALKYANM